MSMIKDKANLLSVGELLSMFENSSTITEAWATLCNRKHSQASSTSLREMRMLANTINFDLTKYDKKAMYSKNPKYCRNCGKELSYDDFKHKKLFCNSSCATSFNNTKKHKEVVEDETHIRCYCKGCNADLGVYTPSRMRKWCKECYIGQLRKSDRLLEKWKNNCASEEISVSDGVSRGEILTSVKPKIIDFLLEEQQHTCSICKSTDVWNGQKLTFILDHVDGDWSNHTRENLRMVCPNCNSQLETTKHKKSGTGRRSQRILWHEYSEKLKKR